MRGGGNGHKLWARFKFQKSVTLQSDHQYMGGGQAESDLGVWFVYDGDCPLCRSAARALKIQAAAGPLHLLNAREAAAHPLMLEIKAAKLDLDEGMVMKYSGNLYHGAQALTLMALLGSNVGWFNRIVAILFKSKTVARICYPFLRGGRNLLLKILGVQKINTF